MILPFLPFRVPISLLRLEICLKGVLVRSSVVQATLQPRQKCLVGLVFGDIGDFRMKQFGIALNARVLII